MYNIYYFTRLVYTIQLIFSNIYYIWYFQHLIIQKYIIHFSTCIINIILFLMYKKNHELIILYFNFIILSELGKFQIYLSNNVNIEKDLFMSYSSSLSDWGMITNFLTSPDHSYSYFLDLFCIDDVDRTKSIKCAVNPHLYLVLSFSEYYVLSTY